MATSQAFGAFISVEPSAASKIQHPPTAVQKPSPSIAPAPDAIEFDRMTWGTRYTGPNDGSNSKNAVPPEQQASPDDPETSRSSSPRPGIDHYNVNNDGDNDDDAVAVTMVQTYSNPPRNKARVGAACLWSLGNGLNDGAPGALIPYLEKDYSIGYAVVSLIFVGNALGVMSAVPFIDALQTRLGRSRTLIIAQSIMAVGYLIVVRAPPFPLVPCAFFLLGFGMAINLAIGNVFTSNLHNGTAVLGVFHGSYGIGATIGPLIATAITSHGARWNRFYIVCICLAFINLGFAGWSFHGYEADRPTAAGSRQQAQRNLSQAPPPDARGGEGRLHKLTLTLRNKVTLLGALFIFAYQGAEVSISGWIISFLISYRDGDPQSVGYVTAGFWAGITLGRLALSQPAHIVGEKRSVFGLVALATVFQVVVWLVPNVVGDAVAVAIVGLLLGPVYPCAMAVFTSLLPRRMHTTSLGAVSALGGAGGAFAPFMTGLGAQSVGTWVLHPVCVGLFVGMEVCWAVLPRVRKRVE
ncbi:MAG: hypothetical protein M1825_002496 [Sarcosagium campestre]|nr:MAG: hypothetical protein M1825_002496 [Sarcosagium campestre]